MSSPTVPTSITATATVVTQTRVRPEHATDFAAWQHRIGDRISAAAGFLDQQVIPPSPPVQPDWTIVQRFASMAAARAWLDSPERIGLVEQAQPWLVGDDDVHVFEDTENGVPRTEPVSAVISTLVAPEKEAEFRAWQRKIAISQAKFPGFQGYKLAPPVPGVQEGWVTILRFDSAAHLDAWMTSPVRQSLLAEAASFAGESRVRVVRTGFDAWFGGRDGAAPPSAWKQNMLVLLCLYPVVFLFGEWVGDPLLIEELELPHWLWLFLSNVVSVLLLSQIVPRASRVFAWWTRPSGAESERVQINWRGVSLIVALYAALMVVFSLFP